MKFPRLIAAFPLIFPLYLFRGELFGIPVTLVEIVLGVAFVFFVIREEIWRPNWWAKHGYKWKIYALWLFLIAAVLGVLFVPEVAYMADGNEFAGRIRALGILKGWIVAPILYFIMARHYFYVKPSLIKVALRSLLLGGVFLSLMAIYQVWTGDYLTMDERASGPFESANYLALYIGPIVVYSLVAFARAKDWSWRIVLGLSSLICIVALYATLSYAAWVAVIFALGVALFAHAKKLPKKVKFGLVASVVLMAVLALVSQLGSAKFDQFTELSDRSSSSVRLQIYEVSVDLIKENPLLGIGLGQFQQQYQENVIEILGQEPFEWNMPHSHNILLAFWLNMGLMGLVAFVWLCWKALPWLLEQDKKERRIAALMLVVILAHGMFDVPYFKNDLSFQFWLLMAILL